MLHTTTRSFFARPRARRAALAVAGAAALAAACGQDPLEAAAATNANTVPIEFVVFPFSTAPASLNTAISILGFGPVRPGVTTAQVVGGVALVPNFDFVVDRAADGRVRFVPSKLIANLTGTGSVLRTGLRTVATPFDSLRTAPNDGYQRDSASVVAVGQTVAIETEPPSCPNGRTFLYAKLVVDSISAASGGIFMRAVIDPNCGYRTVVPNVRPTS